MAVVAPGSSPTSFAMILTLRDTVPRMTVVAEEPGEIARLRHALPGVDEFISKSANEGALNRVGGVALSRSQCGDPLHRAQNLCRDDHRRSWPLLPWWKNIGALRGTVETNRDTKSFHPCNSIIVGRVTRNGMCITLTVPGNVQVGAGDAPDPRRTVVSEDISVSAAQRQDRLSLGKAVPDISGMKDRQRSKIEQLRRALAADGILTLDVQAKVLTLSRSTTWSILRATYKTSGLSAGVIARMLGSPLLPAVARRIILEYVQEKLQVFTGTVRDGGANFPLTCRSRA